MRRFTVSFLNGARREIRRERGYYDRAAGLGHDFVAEVSAAIASIQRMPEASSVVDTVQGEPVRRLLLDRFPFKIVYLVRGRMVVVVAVAHTSRHADYWKRRLKS